MTEKTAQKEPGKKPAPSKKPKPQQEVVVQISLSELHPFPDHPFQVREDAAMQETAESVKEYGVLVPALARPREDGGYELIAGHRRKHACELAGLATMPVIVRNIDRDAATIIMVDSNLQRENILPSERAKAYKMKMEAIKRQGARMNSAMRAAMLLYDFATGLGIPVMVAGHNTQTRGCAEYYVFSRFDAIGKQDAFRLAKLSQTACSVVK